MAMKILHLHSVSILYHSLNFLIIPIDPAPLWQQDARPFRHQPQQVIARVTLSSLAAGPTAPRLPSPCVEDRSHAPGDSPLRRSGSDHLLTPVSTRGVVGRVTLRSVVAGLTAPRLPSPHVGDGSRWT